MAMKWSEPETFIPESSGTTIGKPEQDADVLITPYVDTWNRDIQGTKFAEFFGAAELEGLNGEGRFALPVLKNSVPKSTNYIAPFALDLLGLEQPLSSSEAAQDTPVVESEGELSSTDIEKEHFENLKRQFDPTVIGKIEKNTVLVGIVDTGIPLSHRRHRTKNGATRFLYSWQQSAVTANQPGVRIGSELYAGPLPSSAEYEGYEKPEFSINHLLHKHSVGGLLGALDETSFNRDAGLADTDAINGISDLEFGVSHGAHVADLAVGCDPENDPDGLCNNTRIIAVNLPPERLFGFGGNFLVLYASFAVRRILTVAQAAWEAQYPDKVGGFPLVINFSFGRQAGPKDGDSYWGRTTIDAILERDKTIPTRLIMPSGNQNLARSNARKTLEPTTHKPPTRSERDAAASHVYPDNEITVPWRIQPGDQSHNFVEIWAKTRTQKGQKPSEPTAEAHVSDFRFWISPDGQKDVEPIQFQEPGTFFQLSDFARFYCFSPSKQDRPYFVLAVAPTYFTDPALATSPSGLWTIRMSYLGEKIPQEVTLTVQTDQAGARGIKGGLISYFDHPNYQPYLESGRVRDSFVDSPRTGDCPPEGKCESWDLFGPVQRKGTHNALAAHGDKGGALVVIGGYRLSDGKPALYSSTFDGNAKREGGREYLSVLYPSDESPSHPGILSAGARDGSARTISGTSMATGLATRDLVTSWIYEQVKKGPIQAIGEGWFKGRAERLENVNSLKRGAGMVRYYHTGRRSRLDVIVPPPSD